MRFFRICIVIFAIVFIALCFADPFQFAVAGRNGLDLLFRAVLPILFPFFFISSLIINLSTTTSKYAVPFVVLLSYLSGYPNGAKLLADLHSRRIISTHAVLDLSLLTSTPSPTFVVVSIGTVMLNNTLLGVVIFVSCIMGAIVNYLLWRSHGNTQYVSQTIVPHTEHSILGVFNTSIASSVTGILNVCGVILIFYIFTSLLHTSPIISGLIEMTTGASRVAELHLPKNLTALIICFLVSFGGISVAMQTFVFATTYNLRPMKYLVAKLTHGILSTGIMGIVTHLL